MSTLYIVKSFLILKPFKFIKMLQSNSKNLIEVYGHCTTQDELEMF